MSLASARIAAGEVEDSIVAAWGRSSEDDDAHTSKFAFDAFLGLHYFVTRDDALISNDEVLMSPLFEPITLGTLNVPNRVAMAPMTRYFAPEGVPSAAVAPYYARRARGGVGLIITEGVYVPHASAHAFTNVPHLYGDTALAAWREVVDAVHAEGGVIFPQLWHTGIVRELGMEPDPAMPGYGPSLDEGDTLRTAMTEQQIADVISAFATAARNAKDTGFDGVEIHGAHGYLIDSFFWDRTNRRTDRWGGDLLGRARFGVEVVKAMRREVGHDFPISFRWSNFKQQDYEAKLAETPQELEPFLGALADAGVTVFHTSTRRFWPAGYDDGSNLSLAGWTKKLSGKPCIAVGSMGLAKIMLIDGPSEVPGGGYTFLGSEVSGKEQFDVLESKLAAGEFDMIAVGRSLISDPDWAAKVRDQRLDARIPFHKDHLNRLE